MASNAIKTNTAETFGGMSYDELSRFAADNKPPQKWWDEDHQGLHRDPLAPTAPPIDLVEKAGL